MIRFSIVTAVYNRAAVLEDALRSVHGQTHGAVEHLVIDGASTDGTLAILARHRARLATLVSETDRGVYDALNKGLRLATGDVVGFLHADDGYADPGTLARVASAFADPAVDAVYGDLEYVSRDDPARVVRRWRSGACTPGQLRLGWMPPHPTFFARRELYERLGGFDTAYRIAADYELMLRFIGAGIRMAYVPRVLVRMRLGGMSNRSLRQMWRKSREDLSVMRRHRIGGVGTLAAKNLRKLAQFL